MGLPVSLETMRGRSWRRPRRQAPRARCCAAPLPEALCVWLVWLLALLMSGAGDSVFVTQNGSCSPSVPQGVTQCHTLQAALKDQSVTEILVADNIQLSFAGWTTPSGDTPWIVVARNVTLRGFGLRPDGNRWAIDFNFIYNIIQIGRDNTFTIRGVMVMHTYKDATISVAAVVGSVNSTLVLEDVIRRRPVCSDPKYTLSLYLSFPRPPGYPGPQDIDLVSNVCEPDRCFPGLSLHYNNFAVAVVTPTSETSKEVGGYVLVMNNVTRLCQSFVSQRCIDDLGETECLTRSIQEYYYALRGIGGDDAPPGLSPGAIAGAAVGAAAGALLLAAGAVALIVVLRARRLGAGGSSSGTGLMALLLGHGWGIHQHDTPGSGFDWVSHQVAGEEEQLGPLPDKVQLGLLLGTGAFGRVYRGRWRGMDVAVKVLQHDQSSTAERIQNEARLMMSLQHENVVRAYAIQTWRTRPPAATTGSDPQKSSSDGTQKGGRGPGRAKSEPTPPSTAGASAATAASGASTSMSAPPAVAALSTPAQPPAGKEARDKSRSKRSKAAAAAMGAAAAAVAAAVGSGGSGSTAAGAAAGGGPSISVIMEELPTYITSSQGTSSGRPDGEIWLILEYCDGRTLSDAAREGLLGRRGAPDEQRLLTVLRGVAAGMCYLHSSSVVHGDLKANNVLVTSSPASPLGFLAKVTDFGLSRMLGEGQTHRSTRTVGTITHMPPELLRLGQLSAAGDVYAFGIIMWEAFTGESAFKGMHYGEVVEHVLLRGERPRVPPNMPNAYAALMTQCWNAAPTARPTFDTILEVIDLMLAALQSPSSQGTTNNGSASRTASRSGSAASNGGGGSDSGSAAAPQAAAGGAEEV